jgi:site-specific DNA recombinase
MTTKPTKRVRCAVYTRVSTEYGLDQEFNSLDAQHEAAEAYIRSQAHDGWTLIRTRYDDGGYSGGSTERARRCSGCWRISGTAGSISSWSTRSTA